MSSKTPKQFGPRFCKPSNHTKHTAVQNRYKMSKWHSVYGSFLSNGITGEFCSLYFSECGLVAKSEHK